MYICVCVCVYVCHGGSEVVKSARADQTHMPIYTYLYIYV